MDLTLFPLEGDPISRDRVAKPFTQNRGFKDEWWRVDAKGPLVFCSFRGGPLDEEVARAQIRPHSRIGDAYRTYKRRHLDLTEIDFFEVRSDLYGRNIGREAVALLTDEFPRPCFALSLKGSDGFWRSLGWAEHAHEDAADCDSQSRSRDLLFVQPD